MEKVVPSSSIVSLSWMLNHLTNQSLQAAYQLNHAESFDDAQKAAELFSSPGLNVMYGDVGGNIAWWAVAKLPIRPLNANSKFFLDGASGKDEYLGFYDFSKNRNRSILPKDLFIQQIISLILSTEFYIQVIIIQGHEQGESLNLLEKIKNGPRKK